MTDAPKQMVFVTGATGFVGRALIESLLSSNYDLTILTRSASRAQKLFQDRTSYLECDLAQTGPWQDEFSAAEIVINLVGEPIIGRWTSAKKLAIEHSRIDTTKNVAAAVKASKKCRRFISASAIGIYPSGGAAALREDSELGDSFLAEICKKWEHEAFTASSDSLSVATIRTGLVLHESGGMLKKLLPIFRRGLGGNIGTGDQWMSWIHLDDLVAAIKFLMVNPSLSGPFNATAPMPVLNSTFTCAIGRMQKRPTIFAVPKIALKALYGEGASAITASQRALPARLIEEGFEFRFQDMESALVDILVKK